MSSSDKLEAVDRLILIQVKVERAKEHLRDLGAQILALDHVAILTPDLPPHPITIMDLDNNLKKVPSLPFDVVATAGDVIHNLRSALDHLAYHLVAVGMECAPVLPLTGIEMRQIEFPIAESFEKYESDKSRKTKRMLAEASDAIDRLKPYRGGNEALWRIHELDNIDKHRTLFTLAQDFLFTGEWFPGAYLVRAQNPLFAGVEAQVEKEIELEVKEALNQPQLTNVEALFPSLNHLVSFVDDLVPSFTPLLRNVYERSK